MKFLLLAHGIVGKYRGPAEELAEFLKENSIGFFLLVNPINQKSASKSLIMKFSDGVENFSELRPRFLRFPISLLFDYFHLPSNDFEYVISFNPLASFLSRLKYKKSKHIFWTVDFTPFNNSLNLRNIIYLYLEKLAISNSNIYVDNNPYALQARLRRTKTNRRLSTLLVPISPPKGTKNIFHRSIDRIDLLYFGVVDKRNGVDKIIGILEAIKRNGFKVHCKIIGDGDLLPNLKKEATNLGISENVDFYGHVQSTEDVLSLIESSCIALAPYSYSNKTFTAYADPGKLAFYARAGLPIVMSNAVLMSQVYKEKAGAVVIDAELQCSEWANHVIELYLDVKRLHEAHKSSLKYGISRDAEKTFIQFLQNL